MSKCERCNGYGMEDRGAEEFVRCLSCHGTGEVPPANTGAPGTDTGSALHPVCSYCGWRSSPVALWVDDLPVCRACAMVFRVALSAPEEAMSDVVCPTCPPPTDDLPELPVIDTTNCLTPAPPSDDALVREAVEAAQIRTGVSMPANGPLQVIEYAARHAIRLVREREVARLRRERDKAVDALDCARSMAAIAFGECDEDGTPDDEDMNVEDAIRRLGNERDALRAERDRLAAEVAELKARIEKARPRIVPSPPLELYDDDDAALRGEGGDHGNS